MSWPFTSLSKWPYNRLTSLYIPSRFLAIITVFLVSVIPLTITKYFFLFLIISATLIPPVTLSRKLYPRVVL